MATAQPVTFPRLAALLELSYATLYRRLHCYGPAARRLVDEARPRIGDHKFKAVPSQPSHGGASPSRFRPGGLPTQLSAGTVQGLEPWDWPHRDGRAAHDLATRQSNEIQPSAGQERLGRTTR